MAPFLYDVAVIGAGPAGVQAALSAWHQGCAVLVPCAGEVSQRKGRAYWTKSVPIEDAPGIGPITGPKLRHHLHAPLRGRACDGAGGPRIALVGAYVLQVLRRSEVFAIQASTAPLKDGMVQDTGSFLARCVVVASGCEDGWPEIEVPERQERMLTR